MQIKTFEFCLLTDNEKSTNYSKRQLPCRTDINTGQHKKFFFFFFFFFFFQPIPSRRLTEIFTFREPLNITCPEKYLLQFLKGNTCNNLTKLRA